MARDYRQGPWVGYCRKTLTLFLAPPALRFRDCTDTVFLIVRSRTDAVLVCRMIHRVHIRLLPILSLLGKKHIWLHHGRHHVAARAAVRIPQHPSNKQPPLMQLGRARARLADHPLLAPAHHLNEPQERHRPETPAMAMQDDQGISAACLEVEVRVAVLGAHIANEATQEVPVEDAIRRAPRLWSKS
jgi:hypothetical protein